MKKPQTLILLLLVLILAVPTTMAQEDGILGAIMEAAAAQENASNQAQSEANSEALSEAAAAWQEEWEKGMEDHAEILNQLDTKYLQCTALMILYVHAYLKLVHEHRLGDLSMSACDAYGMQTLALASSTTIMYCPEEMDQLSYEELYEIYSHFKSATTFDTEDGRNVNYVLFGSTPIHLYFKYIQRMIYSSDSNLPTPTEGQLDAATMKYLIEFFKPSFIIPRTLEIGQEMEAMGCSG